MVRRSRDCGHQHHRRRYRVTTDAGACGVKTENMLDGAWTLADLTGLVPTASSGTGKFAGLDAMLDPAKNASPGFIKFMRAGLECKKDYGDGDRREMRSACDGDGVPAKDERTYKGGTLIVEKANTDRAFVTTGQALLKFLTPNVDFRSLLVPEVSSVSGELSDRVNQGPFLSHTREDRRTDQNGRGRPAIRSPPSFLQCYDDIQNPGAGFQPSFLPPRSGEARCGVLSRALRYPTVTTRKLPRVSLWHP